MPEHSGPLTMAAADRGPAEGGDRPVWRIRGRTIHLGRPVVVGILNVTPDSFSDGGVYLDPSLAAERAHALAADGADLIDIGGESTRPGARAVSADEEWSRVGPVLERLQGSIPVPLAVDTTKADVARRALDLGVAVLNDVSGLAADRRLAILAAETGAGLVLMHMRGEPRTMQENVAYRDLLGEIRDGLSSSLRLAIEAGCAPAQLVVDPGIGFGKSAQGNLRLLAELGGLLALGRPVLVGPSRKSFIGKVLDLPVQDRVEGTVAACVMALERGARLFRVHDVREVRRALDLADSIRRAG